MNKKKNHCLRARKIYNISVKKREEKIGNWFIYNGDNKGQRFENYCFEKITFKVLQHVPLNHTLYDKNRYNFLYVLKLL